ncbi:MAG: PD-(D/E)XK nuclease family protein [Crocosphaera sp.]|nr:PD-(D/E)XK nuclease family protein [Crocosphaera sp.]
MNDSAFSENQFLIRLSQAQLNILAVCPPQFQRLYLEQLGSPISPDIQANVLWGNQFHQLMQQHFLGLSIDGFFAENEELKTVIESLLSEVSKRHKINSNVWKEAEHYRVLEKDNYLLTAIYDLLIISEEQAEILDWKTYLEPQNKEKLAQNWQTKLYLYLLTETSKYLPEQISMTYWFVKIPHQPKSLTFEYSQELHKKNEEDLQTLLTNLNQYWWDLHQENIHFPHLKNCESSCPYYRLFSSDNSFDNDLLLNIDDIEELPI